MGKTQAEIQKAYRERKKQNDESYLKRECERVKKYYVPCTEKPHKELKKLRKRAREGMAILRDKRRRLCTEQVVESSAGSGLNSTDPHPGTSRSPDRPTSTSSMTDGTRLLRSQTKNKPGCLVVRMKFSTKERSTHDHSRKRIDRRVSQMGNKMKDLKKHKDTLQKRVWCLEKREQRSRIDTSTDNNTSVNTSADEDDTSINEDDTHQHEDTADIPQQKKKFSAKPRKRVVSTPVKRACYTLRSEGLTPCNHPGLKKTLALHESLIADLNDDNLEHKEQHLSKVKGKLLSGKNIRKSRSASRLATLLNVDRRKSVINKSKCGKRNVQRNRFNNLKNSIIKFLQREDNSTCMPGKKDAVKCGKGKKQTYILSDYLYNLHHKYLAENCDLTVSLSFFTQSRPKYVKPVSFSGRKTCLCQLHQNMSLKIKAVKSLVGFSLNADTFIKQTSIEDAEEKLHTISQDHVTFSVWKKTEMTYNGKTIHRVKLQEETLMTEQFAALFVSEMRLFMAHVKRMITQFQEIRKLKEKLPKGHITAQMDFAENYTCGHLEEVQSAYFDKSQVTLHPVVIHYRQDDKLCHKSYVLVSDEKSHNATAVYAFIKKVVPEFKKVVPELSMIHFLTDSPTSQYRNKTILNLIANHLFSVNASWQYFEAGHGKGPCDGVGGSAKRMADLAVKRGEAVIQNAKDFAKWGNSDGKDTVQYMLVTKEEIISSQADIDKLKLKTVKGTMSLHSVMPLGNGSIAVKETSCFSCCFEDDGSFTPLPTCNWQQHDLTLEASVEIPSQDIVNDDAVSEHDTSTSDILSSQALSSTNTESGSLYSPGEFVAALYEGDWYLGQVVQYDIDDDEALITFMKKTGCKVEQYQWPNPKDELWIPAFNIITKVSPPITCGTTKRAHSAYKLPSSECSKVKFMFSQLKLK